MTVRPMQSALLEGDERPVGPLPESVVRGDNSALLASVAALYLTGSVLDVTYGRGMWWRRFTPATFGKHDLALDGVDFRSLPHEDGSWDSVCFDPPMNFSDRAKQGDSLPTDRKTPCGCWGDLRQGNTQLTWVVTATAFLCSQNHKQGDVVVAVDVGGQS